MAHVGIHLRQQKVMAGPSGLHGGISGDEGSGWVTLCVGTDEIVIHADDVQTLCAQIEQAARESRFQLIDEMRNRAERKETE